MLFVRVNGEIFKANLVGHGKEVQEGIFIAEDTVGVYLPCAKDHRHFENNNEGQLYKLDENLKPYGYAVNVPKTIKPYFWGGTK